jgi:beta-phosphoglucomutase-like phosphatase (HAD superfamily)
LESRRLVQERDAMPKLIARKRRLKAGKNAARTEKWKAARKAVASKKPEAAAETLPTAEQVEEIENKLRAGVIVEMEPVNWPKTKKEIQDLKDYKERVKWARMRGANDKVEPEVYLHTIQKLEEMLKHTK